MKTMEFQVNENLFERIEKAALSAGFSTPDYVRLLLSRSLHEWSIEHLEQQEINAYISKPVEAGEFDGWESEQAWGES